MRKIAKYCNRAETAPIASFSRIISLAAQHAVMQTTTKRVNCAVFARLYHACMREPLRMLDFSSLSSREMFILPRYLNCISINIDVGMFMQNLGSIRCLGAV